MLKVRTVRIVPTARLEQILEFDFCFQPLSFSKQSNFECFPLTHARAQTFEKNKSHKLPSSFFPPPFFPAKEAYPQKFLCEKERGEKKERHIITRVSLRRKRRLASLQHDRGGGGGETEGGGGGGSENISKAKSRRRRRRDLSCGHHRQ